MIAFLSAMLVREIDTARREIEAFPDDRSIWKEVPGLANTSGTLALHLAGNLQHYLGNRLGGTGYLRNRDAEFARRDVPRAELLSGLADAKKAVAATLKQLTDADLAADYPESFDGTKFTTGDFLLHLLSHLNYHVGQMDYHRRCVTKGGAAGAVAMAMLTSAHREDAPEETPDAAEVAPAFDFDEAVAILERTPATLRALLRGLPEPWIRATEGEGTWSPFDVVGHLIDGEESDWIARTRIILEDGPGRPFDPFNRFGHLTANKGKPLSELLDRFAALREANVATLRGFGLTRESGDLPGTHPDLGRVTLRQLLATWVVHDLVHIAQISRVMAKRYASDVGPWGKYLPLLHRRSKG